jgi:hypothetical protein
MFCRHAAWPKVADAVIEAEGGGIPAEDVMERLRKKMEGPRGEPAVWDTSLDRPLFPED